MTVTVQVGVSSAHAKSYAYDNPSYIQADPFQGSIAAAGSSTLKFTSFTQKQLKSITVVPTAAPTANDQLALTLVSLAAQAFGTATGPSYVPTGTNTATSSNTVTISSIVSLGTAPIANPQYAPIDAGTFTVVVANGGGTNTQTGWVAPTGPNGGIALNPGDVVTLTKGTDTVGAYLLEIELNFTPGSTFTI